MWCEQLLANNLECIVNELQVSVFSGKWSKCQFQWENEVQVSLLVGKWWLTALEYMELNGASYQKWAPFS